MSYRTIAHMDLKRPDVQRDLNDRDLLHKRMMSFYPDGLGNNARQAINLLFVANPEPLHLRIESPSLLHIICRSVICPFGRRRLPPLGFALLLP